MQHACCGHDGDEVQATDATDATRMRCIERVSSLPLSAPGRHASRSYPASAARSESASKRPTQHALDWSVDQYTEPSCTSATMFPRRPFGTPCEELNGLNLFDASPGLPVSHEPLRHVPHSLQRCPSKCGLDLSLVLTELTFYIACSQDALALCILEYGPVCHRAASIRPMDPLLGRRLMV